MDQKGPWAYGPSFQNYYSDYSKLSDPLVYLVDPYACHYKDLVLASDFHFQRSVQLSDFVTAELLCSFSTNLLNTQKSPKIAFLLLIDHNSSLFSLQYILIHGLVPNYYRHVK